jgi:hypothetical protein
MAEVELPNLKELEEIRGKKFTRKLEKDDARKRTGPDV